MMFRGAGKLGPLLLFGALAAHAQLLDNKVLNGKYYFRHLSAGADASANITDARSIIGAITFDGAGGYSFTGQMTQGASAPAPQTGRGMYSVDSGGFVTLSNPIRGGASINARYGPEALLGSTTETTDRVYDVFAAVPAATAPGSNASLNGSYRVVTLEFPGGSTANERNTFFNLVSAGQGRLSDTTVSGHAANLNQGRPAQGQLTGASYAVAPDGTGTFTFGAASNGALLSGSRTFYISQSGSVVVGGSTAPGGHDILFGIKAAANATNATWNNTFWAAGLRVEAQDLSAFAGAVSARGTGRLTWTRRLKAVGAGGTTDFTGTNVYSLQSNGTGTADTVQVALGAGGNVFIGSTIDANAPGVYEIYFGVTVPALSAGGVFLHPLGVLNAASFAPAGNPIAPGEFIALYGSGMASGAPQVARPPYPTTLGGVTVLVDNQPAPLYYVSAGQINAIVPYATQGPRSTIVVRNGAASSNSVQVPVARTAPGMFSVDQSGSGPGAIVHANGALVSTDNPAAPGETVILYLTGMGPVSPPAADGAVPGTNTLHNASAPVQVLFGGRPAAAIPFAGLSPQFPGLYQINVTLPVDIPPAVTVPLAVATAEAFHDQVDLPYTP